MTRDPTPRAGEVTVHGEPSREAIARAGQLLYGALLRLEVEKREAVRAELERVEAADRSQEEGNG